MIAFAAIYFACQDPVVVAPKAPEPLTVFRPTKMQIPLSEAKQAAEKEYQLIRTFGEDYWGKTLEFPPEKYIKIFYLDEPIMTNILYECSLESWQRDSWKGYRHEIPIPAKVPQFWLPVPTEKSIPVTLTQKTNLSLLGANRWAAIYGADHPLLRTMDPTKRLLGPESEFYCYKIGRVFLRFVVGIRVNFVGIPFDYQGRTYYLFMLNDWNKLKPT